MFFQVLVIIILTFLIKNKSLSERRGKVIKERERITGEEKEFFRTS